jgi:serine/threonine protein kinase
MEIPLIPDYTLETCCGSGAYGDVWTAKDHSGISRAVKLLDKGRLERLGVLHREEKAITLFRSNVPWHPSLVEIYHVGENEKYIYYVMDIADNLGTPDKYIADTLDERLKKGPLSVSDAKKLLESMLDAVECLHVAGLVHRDIKPSNIIFVGAAPRLADIGLVRSNTASVSIAGTVGFMAPDGSAGSESDLYSLGKLLYCAITGRPVDSFPSLPDFPESADFAGIKLLNRVILKACDKDPTSRFRSAGEFRDALHGRIKRRFRARTLITVAVSVAVSAVALFFSIGSLAKNRKVAYLTEEARTKRNAGDISGAIRLTGFIMEIDPDNVDAKALRNELIRQKIAEEPKVESKTAVPEEQHPMTLAERKEFAMLMLLYNTFMTKGNFFKALEALDSIERKWPYMRENQNIQNFIRKAREKIAEANKMAEAKKAMEIK